MQSERIQACDTIQSGVSPILRAGWKVIRPHLGSRSAELPRESTPEHYFLGVSGSDGEESFARASKESRHAVDISSILNGF